MVTILIFVMIIALGIVIASVISALTSRQMNKPWRRPSRLVRFFAPDFNAFNRFSSPVPGPYRAMKDLEQEIKAQRQKTRHSSHRPRPR